MGDGAVDRDWYTLRFVLHYVLIPLYPGLGKTIANGAWKNWYPVQIGWNISGRQFIFGQQASKHWFIQEVNNRNTISFLASNFYAFSYSKMQWDLKRRVENGGMFIRLWLHIKSTESSISMAR